MITWVRHSQAGQSLLALALGLALALRIMMPPGFMPAATPQGMLIQLCSGLALGADAPILSTQRPDWQPQSRKPDHRKGQHPSGSSADGIHNGDTTRTHFGS
jgi:hypothetical protein